MARMYLTNDQVFAEIKRLLLEACDLTFYLEIEDINKGGLANKIDTAINLADIYRTKAERKELLEVDSSKEQPIDDIEG